jgi:hypothetical protein
MILKLLKIKASISFTMGYEPEYINLNDFRQNIHPKKTASFEQKPYFQVFEERHGFMKNLSIVDLLFNQGPQSLNYL